MNFNWLHKNHHIKSNATCKTIQQFNKRETNYKNSTAVTYLSSFMKTSSLLNDLSDQNESHVGNLGKWVLYIILKDHFFGF